MPPAKLRLPRNPCVASAQIWSQHGHNGRSASTLFDCSSFVGHSDALLGDFKAPLPDETIGTRDSLKSPSGERARGLHFANVVKGLDVKALDQQHGRAKEKWRLGHGSANRAGDAVNGTTKMWSHFLVQPSPSTSEVRLDGLALDRECFLLDHALICRFTKSWPKFCYLHVWVSGNWKEYLVGEINMYPCAKGFFILEFDSQKDKELVLENGPWFYQEDFLCMKPWFLNFDPHTKNFTTAFLWV